MGDMAYVDGVGWYDYDPEVVYDTGPTDAVDRAVAIKNTGGAGPTFGGDGPDPVAIDWRSWLEDWGFPPDVIAQLDRMARQYTPAQADLFARDAIMYLRGTDWHKKTFVGFADAYKSGLLTDERQYRAYVQQANDLYRRYHGRDISSDELVNAFVSGYNVNRLGGELEAGAFVNANRNDLQYASGNFGVGDEREFSQDQMMSIGRQQAGIGNALGAGLLEKVAKAQQRIRRIFEGTLATGDMAPPPGSRRSSGAGTTLADIGR